MTPKQALIYAIVVAAVVYAVGLVLGVGGSLELRVGFAIAMGAMSGGMMMLAQYLKNRGDR